MRAVAFCFLALVVAASAREFPLARSLLQTTELDCKAESSATLDLQGSGTGFAQSTAFCQALADAEKAIESVVKGYIEKFDTESSNGQCTKATASESVTEVAKAIASAYTSVTTKVEITGTGTACASGFAAGDALAVSLVKVYLEVSLELIEKQFPNNAYGEQVKKAVDDKESAAAGGVQGSASAAAIATAWAAATGKACTTGGFESDFQESFVKSTTVAIAELWATVVLELCSNFADAKTDELKEWAEETAKSFSEIGGEVTVDGTTEVSGTEGGAGSGTAEEIPPCSMSKGVCCSDSNKGQDSCSCGSGCTMTKSSGGGPRIVWEDGTGAMCFCS